MENIHNSPPPLKRKLFLTALAGLLCLLIGISMCIFAKEQDYAVFELRRMHGSALQGNLPVPGFIGEKVLKSRRQPASALSKAPAEVPEDPDYGR